MRLDNVFTVNQPIPMIVGTGLVTLDIVINGGESESPLMRAGGSCGNVLSILAYLGWRSFPVTRLGVDVAADLVAKDLDRFGVRLDFLYREMKGHTPIVIESIPDGTPAIRTHFFSFSCPYCGAPLPSHRAIWKTSVQHIIEQVPNPSVFYFDRVSPAAIEMAQRYAAEGALVVFEPSGIKNGKLFRECLLACHIIKYSHERLRHIVDLTKDIPPFFEIETLGASGLRFRTRVQNGRPSNWEYMEAYKVDDIKDEAGCGDWCTAGIIHVLGQKGVHSFKEAGKEQVLHAMSFGQALAALNCRFEGARGGMYSQSFAEFRAAVKNVTAGKEPNATTLQNAPERFESLLRSICPYCCNSLSSP